MRPLSCMMTELSSKFSDSADCNEIVEKMMLLVRPFFMGFCLWLAAWVSAVPAVAAGVSCEDWNTAGFFQRAGVADVSRCLKARANPNARGKHGRAPLHAAAAKSKTPSVVTTLLDSGADPAARDKAGETPWDYIKADSPLKGTDVYWRLNEGRFR